MPYDAKYHADLDNSFDYYGQVNNSKVLTREQIAEYYDAIQRASLAYYSRWREGALK